MPPPNDSGCTSRRVRSSRSGSEKISGSRLAAPSKQTTLDSFPAKSRLSPRRIPMRSALQLAPANHSATIPRWRSAGAISRSLTGRAGRGCGTTQEVHCRSIHRRFVPCAEQQDNIGRQFFIRESAAVLLGLNQVRGEVIARLTPAPFEQPAEIFRHSLIRMLSVFEAQTQRSEIKNTCLSG